MADKNEIIEELRSVLSGQNSFLDAALPPIVFLIANALSSLEPAAWMALAVGGIFMMLRLLRRENGWYALGGIAAAGLAAGLALLSGSAQAFFLPTLINGGITVLALFVSVLIKRPAVAFTSFLTRRWPLQWYWHEKVRPAYSAVTAIWIVFFGGKLLVQAWLYMSARVESLGLFNLISGWPATILLLVISYIYGQNRLEALRGPSVEEFKKGTPPPWNGQQRGF